MKQAADLRTDKTALIPNHPSENTSSQPCPPSLESDKVDKQRAPTKTSNSGQKKEAKERTAFSEFLDNPPELSNSQRKYFNLFLTSLRDNIALIRYILENEEETFKNSLLISIFFSISWLVFEVFLNFFLYIFITAFYIAMFRYVNVRTFKDAFLVKNLLVMSLMLSTMLLWKFSTLAMLSFYVYALVDALEKEIVIIKSYTFYKNTLGLLCTALYLKNYLCGDSIHVLVTPMLVVSVFISMICSLGCLQLIEKWIFSMPFLPEENERDSSIPRQLRVDKDSQRERSQPETATKDEKAPENSEFIDLFPFNSLSIFWKSTLFITSMYIVFWIYLKMSLHEINIASNAAEPVVKEQIV
ncbi:hypothetical protein NEMIN01_0301 [Nematocida minor]|uniref:uncharacterized protein n=1 Tax=Nematocida minor TaxID=1912983 RepID=UPI00221EF453|nr:uncharacterized protein NEMIN01_0301 [Nematocida minor]KAI5189135.1 hypothetical protein NEMIN01_0301 [Nematocida minor]